MKCMTRRLGVGGAEAGGMRDGPITIIAVERARPRVRLRLALAPRQAFVLYTLASATGVRQSRANDDE